MWERRKQASVEALLDAIYFSGPFGGTGSTLYSAVIPGLLLALYRALGFGRSDIRGVLGWFLLGWLGHAVADFLTHTDDTRPLFWPISRWEWSSPVSYRDPRYHGRRFMVAEHGAC